MRGVCWSPASLPMSRLVLLMLRERALGPQQWDCGRIVAPDGPAALPHGADEFALWKSVPASSGYICGIQIVCNMPP